MKVIKGANYYEIGLTKNTCCSCDYSCGCDYFDESEHCGCDYV